MSAKDIGAYFRGHKLTCLLLLVSLAGMAACVVQILREYSVDHPRTSIWLSLTRTIRDGNTTSVHSAGPESFQHISIDITYGRKAGDKLLLGIRFKGDYQQLTVLTSDNLRRDERSPLRARDGIVSTQRESGSNRYSYTLAADYLQDAFEGNIFGLNGQDLTLDYSMTVGFNASLIEKVPQRVIIRDIGNLTVGYAHPEPSKRFPHMLIYEYDPTRARAGDSPSGITFVAMNRIDVSASQTRVLILGIIAGVLSSMVASIVLELVRRLEERQIS